MVIFIILFLDIWLSWVVAFQNFPETESISLVPFKELYGEGIRFNQVQEEVDKLFPQ